MSAYSYVLAASVLANLIIAVLVVVSARRAFPRAGLLMFLLAFAATHGMLLGLTSTTLGPAWAIPSLAFYALAHASVPAFAILFLFGEPIRKRVPVLSAILGTGLVLAAICAAVGIRQQDTFQPTTDIAVVALNGYLVTCLGIALAESLARWRRSVAFRRESFLLVAGTVALIIGGPIYSFELVVLGITDLLGANPAAPIGGALFSLALLRSNPVPFLGHEPQREVRIPWTVPPGTYLVEETRPKYAEAMALASRGPTLALVSEQSSSSPTLGVEVAKMPAGDRCASVVASTISEFLTRNPDGTVLIDDLSYVVANAGARAAAEGLTRVVRARPNQARLIVSLSLMTEDERLEIVRSVPGTQISAPDFESEIGAILNAHLGGSKDHLLKAALARGKRIEDLVPSDLPALHDHWLASLADLKHPADEAAQTAWRRVSEALTADLEVLWRTPPTEPRPPLRPAAPLEVPMLSATGAPSPDGFALVRATDVLEAVGRAKLDEPEAKPFVPLGTAVRDAFLGSLGPAGEAVYRRVLWGLRKDTGAIGREDLKRVATLAEEALSDLSQAVDVDAARRDLSERRQSLLNRLEAIGRGMP